MVECFKWVLMGHTSRSLEVFFAESNLNWADMGQEVSEENFSMWHRDCFCSILVKNVTAFCPCLKSLSEAKVERFILTALTKEISKNPVDTFFSD